MQEIAERAFSFLHVYRWRQFADVRIDFHPRVTIITGANGAGKTTLLHLLAPHVGWSVPFVSMPSPFRDAATYVSNLWTSLAKSSSGFEEDGRCGEVGFASGEQSVIGIPRRPSGAGYEPSYEPKRAIAGIYIPSHRPVFVASNARFSSKGRQYDMIQACEAYTSAVRSAWSSDGKSGESPLRLLKQTLLGWNASGDSARDDFSAVLANVLPSKLGFRGMLFERSNVLLQTRSGVFSLDAVSGGVAAIIDLSWQLFLYSRRKDVPGSFVAILDEPENHLHPEMQRSVLFKLSQEFPQAQFIVATHSPLVVTSVRDAHVYVLAYADDMEPSRHHVDALPTGDRNAQDAGIPFRPGNYESLVGYADAGESFAEPAQRVVYAEKLGNFEKGGSANHILTKVLGLDYTMPEWAANVLDTAVKRVSSMQFTDAAMSELKTTLEANELSQYMPEALSLVVDEEPNGPNGVAAT